MIKVIEKGQSWQQIKRFTANTRLVICGGCQNIIFWTRGDYWDLPDDKKIRCPHCPAMIRVGDLLP